MTVRRCHDDYHNMNMIGNKIMPPGNSHIRCTNSKCGHTIYQNVNSRFIKEYFVQGGNTVTCPQCGTVVKPTTKMRFRPKQVPTTPEELKRMKEFHLSQQKAKAFGTGMAQRKWKKGKSAPIITSIVSGGAFEMNRRKH